MNTFNSSSIELGNIINNVKPYDNYNSINRLKTEFASTINGNFTSQTSLKYGDLVILNNKYPISGKNYQANIYNNNNKLETKIGPKGAAVFMILRSNPIKELQNKLNNYNQFVKNNDKIILKYVGDNSPKLESTFFTNKKANLSILNTSKNRCNGGSDIGLIENNISNSNIQVIFEINNPSNNNKVNNQNINNGDDINLINFGKGNKYLSTCNWADTKSTSLKLSAQTISNPTNSSSDSDKVWKITKINTSNYNYVTTKIKTNKSEVCGTNKKGQNGDLYFWGYSSYSSNILWIGMTNSLNNKTQPNFTCVKTLYRSDNDNNWNTNYFGNGIGGSPLLFTDLPVKQKDLDLHNTIHKNNKHIINMFTALQDKKQDADSSNKIEKIKNANQNVNINNTNLQEKKNRNNRIQKEINDRKHLILTRKRMLEISEEKNIYKQKLIYTYIAIILTLILIIIVSYYYFNK